MKKILLIVLASSMLLIGANASAQIVVGAGYVNSTSSTKVKSDSKKSKTSTTENGVYIGASYNVSIFNGIGVAPGLYYEFLTGKTKPVANVKSTTNEHFVNIPVLVTYTYQVQKGMNVGAHIGPNFQYGLSSKTVIKSGSTKTKYNNYGSNSTYAKLNPQLALGLSFEYEGISVSFGYDLGMRNLYTGSTGKEKIKLKRSDLRIGVGYSF